MSRTDEAAATETLDKSKLKPKLRPVPPEELEALTQDQDVDMDGDDQVQQQTHQQPQQHQLMSQHQQHPERQQQHPQHHDQPQQQQQLHQQHQPLTQQLANHSHPQQPQQFTQLQSNNQQQPQLQHQQQQHEQHQQQHQQQQQQHLQPQPQQNGQMSSTDNGTGQTPNTNNNGTVEDCFNAITVEEDASFDAVPIAGSVTGASSVAGDVEPAPSEASDVGATGTAVTTPVSNAFTPSLLRKAIVRKPVSVKKLKSRGLDNQQIMAALPPPPRARWLALQKQKMKMGASAAARLQCPRCFRWFGRSDARLRHMRAHPDCDKVGGMRRKSLNFTPPANVVPIQAIMGSSGGRGGFHLITPPRPNADGVLVGTSGLGGTAPGMEEETSTPLKSYKQLGERQRFHIRKKAFRMLREISRSERDDETLEFLFDLLIKYVTPQELASCAVCAGPTQSRKLLDAAEHIKKLGGYKPPKLAKPPKASTSGQKGKKREKAAKGKGLNAADLPSARMRKTVKYPIIDVTSSFPIVEATNVLTNVLIQ